MGVVWGIEEVEKWWGCEERKEEETWVGAGVLGDKWSTKEYDGCGVDM